jgi:hypothetical protein
MTAAAELRSEVCEERDARPVAGSWCPTGAELSSAGTDPGLRTPRQNTTEERCGRDSFSPGPLPPELV